MCHVFPQGSVQRVLLSARTKCFWRMKSCIGKQTVPRVSVMLEQIRVYKTSVAAGPLCWGSELSSCVFVK